MTDAYDDDTEIDAATEAVNARLADHLAKFDSDATLTAQEVQTVVHDILRWIVDVNENGMLMDDDLAASFESSLTDD